MASKNRRIARNLYYQHGAYYYVRKVRDPETGAARNKWTRLAAKTEAEALRALAERREDKPQRGTLGALLAAYPEDYPRWGRLAPGTRKNYEVSIKRLRRVFGHMLPDELTPEDCGTYIDSHPSPSAANRDMAVLSGVYRLGRRRGWIRIPPPMDGLDRAEEPTRDRYVSDAEFLAVREYCLREEHRVWWPLGCAMAISYTTGLREGTVLAIRLGTWDDGELRVHEGKTGWRARVTMTPQLHETLEETRRLLRRKVTSLYLITSRNGTRMTESGFKSSWRRMMSAALAAGIIEERFRFHDLRAKHATDRDEQGLNAQLALGHPDPSTTRKYIRHKLGRKFAPMPLPTVTEEGG